MARVSKKVSAARREEERVQHRIWRTAIYARLSDFDEVMRDAGSLEIQIEYIREYIERQDDLLLLDIFADKGCTGTNFVRPAFERLLKALQERKIDCIVVKDLSRLGRNFVETGQYLEQVFPLFGVRFIAINDHYDSSNEQNRDGMVVPIKSMINEMYSKDLSQKVRSCFRSKEARGEIYTLVPFGYKKNRQNRLVLDEEVCDMVLQIFLWKKAGQSEHSIAKELTAQGVPTPFTRRCQLGYLKNTERVKDPAWQTAFVTKVLENPIYTGTMIYNRIAYDETYRRIGENPRENWHMIPDNHPAIISWELFDAVAAVRENERKKRQERHLVCRQRREKHPNIFEGRLFCRECGKKMVCRWPEDGTLYFYCYPCHTSIAEKDLWVRLNQAFARQVEERQNPEKLLHRKQEKGRLLIKRTALQREMDLLTGKLLQLETQKRNGYEEYALGKLPKEKFLELRRTVEDKAVELRQEKEEREKELASISKELCHEEGMQVGMTTLTSENLQQYVKRIEVGPKKQLCAEFGF